MKTKAIAEIKGFEWTGEIGRNYTATIEMMHTDGSERKVNILYFSTVEEKLRRDEFEDLVMKDKSVIWRMLRDAKRLLSGVMWDSGTLVITQFYNFYPLSVELTSLINWENDLFTVSRDTHSADISMLTMDTTELRFKLILSGSAYATLTNRFAEPVKLFKVPEVLLCLMDLISGNLRNGLQTIEVSESHLLELFEIYDKQLSYTEQ